MRYFAVMPWRYEANDERRCHVAPADCNYLAKVTMYLLIGAINATLCSNQSDVLLTTTYS